MIHTDMHSNTQKTNIRISTKIKLFNMLIGLAFLAILLVIGFSFFHIRSLMETVSVLNWLYRVF